MKILEQKFIDVSQYNKDKKVFFIRINPENLSLTISEILTELRTMSWLNKFNFEPLKEAYSLRAKNTCDYLERVLQDKSDLSKLKETTGEYVVSNLSKKSLVENLQHTDIPLMELLGRKKSNNPGFDFYTEKDFLIVAGEAKYKANQNAYNSSLKQINEFVKEKKHIQDIPLLMPFVNPESLVNLNNNKFFVCAAFSSTDKQTDDLIVNILNNAHFKECLEQFDIFLVAVDMYGE